MGKKKSAKHEAEEDREEKEDETDGEPKEKEARKKSKKTKPDNDPEKKTNLGDTATIKRLLDDAAIEVSRLSIDPSAMLRFCTAHANGIDHRTLACRSSWILTLWKTPH